MINDEEESRLRGCGHVHRWDNVLVQHRSQAGGPEEHLRLDVWTELERIRQVRGPLGPPGTLATFKICVTLC